jgi:hypothetical protein
MNATQNTRGNKHLVYAFRRKTCKQQRGSVVYSEDQLRTELLEYCGSTNEGVTITSMIKPPVAIKAMDALPAPGRWFQCLVNQDHVIESDLKPHHQDNYITADHATRVIYALGIIQQGYVAHGLGQSNGYEGMVYFFDKAHMSSGSFYSAYTFLNDTSPDLWSSTVECLINRNSHYGAKKYGPQLAQPPKTITVTAALFHCIHVTDIQRV